jgi:hypothetical protein
MTSIDQIDAMITLFKQISMLHRPDLENTLEMPNWNASFTRLLKLKQIATPLDMIANAKALKLETLSELTLELPKMVDSTNLPKALALCNQIKNGLKNLITSLQDPMPEEGSSFRLG